MPTLEPEASYIEKYGALPSHAEIEAYRVELRERFDIDNDLPRPDTNWNYLRQLMEVSPIPKKPNFSEINEKRREQKDD